MLWGIMVAPVVSGLILAASSARTNRVDGVGCWLLENRVDREWTGTGADKAVLFCSEMQKWAKQSVVAEFFEISEYH